MRSLLAPTVKLAVFTVVTLFFTTVLGFTIANVTFAPESEYTARFTDVLSLNVGDDVRMHGVRVGKVTSIVTTGSYAEVGFTVDGDRKLAKTTTAAMKIRNLIGQRYVSLESPAPRPGDELPEGAVIPLDRTRPALNLTELFNGFRPLFQALRPEDVNQLAGEIIQVLQGEGGTVSSVLAHTASLTATLAERDQVIGEVVTNLTRVLASVNAGGDDLTAVIDRTQSLVSGLAAQRKPLGAAVEGITDLADTTAGLVRRGRAPLEDGIAGLHDLAANLNASAELVDRTLRNLPRKTEAVTRVVSYGSWLNFYLCSVSGTVGVESLNTEVSVLPLPATSQAERCRS